MNILIDASAAYFYHSTGIGSYAAELIAALKEYPIAEYISVYNGKTIRPLREKDTLIPTTQCDFWEYTVGDKAECPANTSYSEDSHTIGISGAFFLGVGGEFSVGYNLKTYLDELIYIFEDTF